MAIPRAKRASPTDVTIDLTEDDVENGEKEAGNSRLESLRKRLSRIPSVAAASKKKVKREPAGTETTSENASTTDDRKPAAKTASEEDQEDVEVIEAPRFVPSVATGVTGTSDEIEVVGTVNQVLLPHMRQHCTEKPFFPDGTTHKTAAEQLTNNMKVCSLCYCYVCDVEASKCPRWWDNHCSASNSGPRSAYWTAQREQHKQNTKNAARGKLPTRRATCFGLGPFPPDTEGASGQADLTKCRKCEWFNKFEHKNFQFDREVASGVERERTIPRWYRKSAYDYSYHNHKSETHPTGYLDWCHACGCVASERDLRKAQSHVYVPSEYSICLGTKDIEFRLKAHDPREMECFLEKWVEHEWTYNESEMEQELFDHRLGELPLLEMIVASMPIATEDKIPTDGKQWATSQSQSQWREGDNAKASLSETEAVLIDNHVDGLILKELFKNSPKFGAAGAAETDEPTLTQFLDGDITATWDSNTRKGKFTLRVFVNMKAPVISVDKKTLGLALPPRILTAPAYLTQFLGSWYGVFPFLLRDVCGLIRSNGEPLDIDYNWAGKCGIPLPPFTLDKDTSDDLVDVVSAEKAEIEKRQNEIVDERANTYALESGTGCSLLGGLCTNETDFAGSLKRYFREILPDVVLGVRRTDLGLVGIELGVVSRHRSMRKSETWIIAAGCGNYSTTTREESAHKYDSFLSSNEYAFAITSMRDDAILIHDKTKTLNGLMDHLENLGHTAAPFVEGLAVELLPFQSQTVQWATEREQTPGGINAFLWTKLPSVAQPNTDLYFSPILEELTATKPKLARGGIIAEQMGLGKTVISLAMILRNPAPPLPASGTAVSSINVTPAISSGAAFWDPDLYSRTSASKKKRGSIISRGTLVVCNVSLVGQWIEEAKSKLKDPGLVYSYHGTGRKRDPKVLAANSIVVTTYETLASDATYHASRSGEGDEYAAPCEQVRWWRIICDESHSIRNAGGKTSAVLELVGDNRWLVSGTPVNTSLMDLEQQLKFLGIEKAGSILRKLKKSTFRHIRDRNANNGTGWRRNNNSSPEMPKLGNFTFLMRSIMMRHSQKQMYRDTSTTLMSLPPKTHRSILVNFSAADRGEYDTLETTARAYYQSLKEQEKGPISRHFLALMQKLNPLRIACAGGRIPLDDDHNETEEENDSDEDDEIEEKPKKRKAKKLSEFAFTSKLKTLVAELERNRIDDPTAKSLVFSQFTSTLQWLKEELPKHGFQFRTLSGDMPMKKRAKALSDFQNDPPTTIFLLSMRAGAVGINLTQANRIFLMEPCFNPALEAQAVGRVHRLGQKRNVEIIRLLMKDSVESRMVEMLEKKYGKADCSQEDGETDSDTVADDDNNDDDDDADDNDDDDDDTTDGNKKPVAIDAAGTADGDKKPAAIDDGKKPAAAQQVMIGSLYTDKATVVAEEFDLLYGVEPTDTVMEEVSGGGDDLVLEADEGADAVNDDENDDAMWI